MSNIHLSNGTFTLGTKCHGNNCFEVTACPLCGQRIIKRSHQDTKSVLEKQLKILKSSILKQEKQVYMCPGRYNVNNSFTGPSSQCSSFSRAVRHVPNTNSIPGPGSYSLSAKFSDTLLKGSFNVNYNLFRC